MHQQRIYCGSNNDLENTKSENMVAFTTIYLECISVCREGGHVSECVVPGGWSVQQVTPQLFMLCCGPHTYLTHTSHTHTWHQGLSMITAASTHRDNWNQLSSFTCHLFCRPHYGFILSLWPVNLWNVPVFYSFHSQSLSHQRAEDWGHQQASNAGKESGT